MELVLWSRAPKQRLLGLQNKLLERPRLRLPKLPLMKLLLQMAILFLVKVWSLVRLLRAIEVAVVLLLQVVEAVVVRLEL